MGNDIPVPQATELIFNLDTLLFSFWYKLLHTDIKLLKQREKITSKPICAHLNL